MQLMLTPTSPYARSVRIALMIKGLDAECAMHWVDPPSDTPELVQANPICRVPVLVLDNGTTLSETLLIMQYLERRTPDPTLLPNSLYLEELALAGKGMGLIDAAFWTVFNRRFGGKTAEEGNELAKRRMNAIERTLDQLKAEPPHPVKHVPGLGQILVQVALDYMEFRLPEIKATERSGLAGWGKPLHKLEAFALTEFY